MSESHSPCKNANTTLFVYHLPSSASHSSSSSLLSLWLCHLPQQKPVEPSLNAPPPSPLPSSPLDDLLSHSLTFSFRLIPLTMHVPKTDLIFIHGTTPPPTPPPAPAPPLSCITSFPNVLSSCPSPPSHLPIALPQAPPVSPNNPPTPCWNLEACVGGVSTNPEPLGGIKP